MRADRREDEVRELIDLLDVARLVVSTLDVNAVLDAILASAMKLTGTSAGSIALYNKDTGELEMKAHSGFSKNFVGDAKWKVRPGGLTHRILSSSQPTVITDTTDKKFFSNPLAISEGIKSIMCVPLVLEDDIIGVFYVDDFTPREFTERETRLMSILSSFAAMSINHARQHEMARRLAVTDGLTGLYNHRYFQEVLQKEITRADRYGEGFALIIVDIDDFKPINDTYGHQFGDRALKELSVILTESCRESDTLARYGGEEFAIVLPKVVPEQAYIMAQRMRSNIKTCMKKFMKNKKPLTVSIGAAYFPSDAKDRHVLIEKADRALYHAKSSGKDMVVEFRRLKRINVA